MSSKIEYKQGIVTFVDLLGWRNLLVTKTPDELAKVLEILRSEGDPNTELLQEIDALSAWRRGEDEGWGSMYEYATLSDCVFRCTDSHHKINKELPHGQLFHELMDLMFIQARLAHEGYLIRGAVTYGKYHGARDSHGSALFGPAIARAYEIETKLANYPRIVIDPAVIEGFFLSKVLKSYHHSHNYEWSKHIKPLLRRDESGVWFLDYLGGFIDAVGEQDPVLGFFERHKDLVEMKLAEMKKERPYPDSITDKVLWLLRYHNATINRLTKADLRWLSGDGYKAKKEDFLVEIPDHPVFKEYELILDDED